MRVLTECGGRQGCGRQAEYAALAGLRSAETRSRPAGLSEWIDAHLPEIRQAAEATTSVGKLVEIHPYIIGRLLYLRFNYTTGDAAGQNMVGKATLAACHWIQGNHPATPGFVLSGNIDTDKSIRR